MKVLKVFVCNFQIIAMGKICITFYQACLISHLITPCNSLSHYITLFPRLETKPFLFGNYKTSSQVSIFLKHLTTPCHSSSHLSTPYHLYWEKKQFHLATLKLVPMPQFSHHILSHLSLLTTRYPLYWKQNQFHLATLKLVPRPLISYHILSHLVISCHTLSPILETKPFSFGNFKISSQTPDLLSHLIMVCHSLSHFIL